ncbi:hypothetical protein TDB9533_04749 [Thalassocella blandensis]|nr:hypothetical protein TDB9533_04749 [Thalassocella blandensis]
MSAYNILEAESICPRCNSKNGEVLLYLGVRNQDRYKINQVINLGLPIDNVVGSGWVDCEVCDRDYFVRVYIREGKFCDVEVDYAKVPNTPDECLDDLVYDHFNLEARSADLLVYENYSIASVRFDGEEKFYYVKLLEPFSKKEQYKLQLQYPIFTAVEDYLEMNKIE